MKKTLLVTGLSLWLIGCSPQSAAELRRNHAQQTSFTVSAPYDTVYRRVHEQARLNFTGGVLGSRYRVEHALFSQRNTANVSMYVETRMRNTMLLTIDISRASDDHSKIDVYWIQDPFAEKYAREVPHWAGAD